LVVALLAAIAFPSFVAKASKSKQAEAKQNIGALNRAQQAYFLEQNTFTNSIDKLGVGIKTQTENYNYSIRATPKAVFNYGVAQKDDLKSYVGGVFAVPAKEIPNSASSDEILTLAILCQANSLGTTRPVEPTYKNGQVACGSGTKDVSRR
jgi:type II secretory pathway pseudopilin PulG